MILPLQTIYRLLYDKKKEKRKTKHVQSFVLKKVENLQVFQPPRNKSEL